MTNDELRARLKHIAGLCLSLAIDAGQHEDETHTLRKRIRELEAATAQKQRKKSKRRYTEEQREAQRERMRTYHARKKAEKAAKEQGK